VGEPGKIDLWTTRKGHPIGAPARHPQRIEGQLKMGLAGGLQERRRERTVRARHRSGRRRHTPDDRNGGQSCRCAQDLPLHLPGAILIHQGPNPGPPKPFRL
jgi:hypothetical protein